MSSNEEKVRNGLKRYFGDNVKGFDNILIETKALVAGGGILQYISPKEFKSSDIDIYVTRDGAVKLKDFIIQNGFEYGFNQIPKSTIIHN